jgi:DNA adenine methylase
MFSFNFFKRPPLTYYGGKQQLSKRIVPLIPEHKIYDEPFFGGGAIFFAKPPAKVEFINDTNGEVVNFYRVLKHDFAALKKDVDCTLHSEGQHKEAIAIYRNPEGATPVRRAWAVWVLSHQSIYAILCNSWKCSMQRNSAKLVTNKKEAFTEAYQERLENTSIFCRDALDVIAKTDTPETFHYVDPPYFQSDMGHYKGYSREDFEKLLKLLSTVKGKFMLSSYPSDLLKQYIKENSWRTIEIEMRRSAGGGVKTEVITINYEPPLCDAELAQAA